MSENDYSAASAPPPRRSPDSSRPMPRQCGASERRPLRCRTSPAASGRGTLGWVRGTRPPRARPEAQPPQRRPQQRGVLPQILPAEIIAPKTLGQQPLDPLAREMVVLQQRRIDVEAAVVDVGDLRPHLLEKGRARIGRDHVEIGEGRAQAMAYSRTRRIDCSVSSGKPIMKPATVRMPSCGRAAMKSPLPVLVDRPAIVLQRWCRSGVSMPTVTLVSPARFSIRSVSGGSSSMRLSIENWIFRGSRRSAR